MPITNNSNFIEDLGFDSLDLVELTMAVENEFGIEILDEDVESLVTIGKSVNYLNKHVRNEQ